MSSSIIRSIVRPKKLIVKQFTTPIRYIPVRSTWVVKRRYDLPRSNIDGPFPRELREPIDYTYETLYCEDKKTPQPIKVIITKNVENVGLKGDIVSVDRWMFRRELQPAGEAVYMTDENLELYADDIAARRERRRRWRWRLQPPVSDGQQTQQEQQEQSVAGFTTASALKRLTLTVPMSAHNEWQLEAGHVRAALRRAGYMVPSHCLMMTPDTEDITHDNIRDFNVQITVNNIETVTVKCQIVLYSKEYGEVKPDQT